MPETRRAARELAALAAHAARQDALERDARLLLDVFVRTGSSKECNAVLQGLPDFQTQDEAVPVNVAASARHAELADLCEDNVNGATAMQVQPFLGDTAFYPLLVLLQAASWATDMPLVFYIDIVYALVCSVLRKELYVQLNGRKTKNRYWTAATADIGQGKSPAMEPLLEAMKKVLRRHPAFAMGSSVDGFHYQKASTTASAVLKLRQCHGYLTLCSDESGMCLSPALAMGGATDVAKHVDLPLFLNAAHGGDFSWSTKPDREKAMKAAAAPPNPAEAVRHGVASDQRALRVDRAARRVFQVLGAAGPQQANWRGTKVFDVFRREAVNCEEAVEHFLARCYAPHS